MCLWFVGLIVLASCFLVCWGVLFLVRMFGVGFVVLVGLVCVCAVWRGFVVCLFRFVSLCLGWLSLSLLGWPFLLVLWVSSPLFRTCFVFRVGFYFVLFSSGLFICVWFLAWVFLSGRVVLYMVWLCVGVCYSFVI